MNTITIGKNTYTMPSHWNELTTAQLRFLVALQLAAKTEATFLALMVEHFLGIGRSAFIRLSPEIIAELAQTIRFTVDPADKITLTKQHFPRTKNLYALDDGIIDATFEQFFEYTEPAYVRYRKDQNPQMLVYLYAAMHSRQKGAFNPAHMDQAKQTAQKQRPVLLHANLLFYAGCRNFLVKKFGKIFSGGNATAKEPDGLEFMRLLAGLNRQDLSRNQELRKTNLYEALVFMEKTLTEKPIPHDGH